MVCLCTSAWCILSKIWGLALGQGPIWVKVKGMPLVQMARTFAPRMHPNLDQRDHA